MTTPVSKASLDQITLRSNSVRPSFEDGRRCFLEQLLVEIQREIYSYCVIDTKPLPITGRANHERLLAQPVEAFEWIKWGLPAELCRVEDGQFKREVATGSR